MQTHDTTRFNPNGHERPRTPYRVGRAGFEHPRELRVPLDWPPLMTSRPDPRHARFSLAVVLPSGLRIKQVRDA